MYDEYFAVLAYDHRVECGFYDHAVIRESYEQIVTEPDELDIDGVPYFDIDDDDEIII